MKMKKELSEEAINEEVMKWARFLYSVYKRKKQNQEFSDTIKKRVQ